MEPTQDEIRRQIEATRAAMAAKIETLEERVGGAIQEAKRSVSLTYQTQRRPWLMVGLATALGYMMEGIVFGRAPSKAGGKKFKQDPERRAYLEGRQKSSGFIRNLATAAGIAMARNAASNLVSQGTLFPRSRAGSEDRPSSQSPHTYT